jgi:hypothetical protein
LGGTFAFSSRKRTTLIARDTDSSQLEGNCDASFSEIGLLSVWPDTWICLSSIAASTPPRRDRTPSPRFEITASPESNRILSTRSTRSFPPLCDRRMSPFAISSFIFSCRPSNVPFSWASSPVFACTSFDSSSLAAASSVFSASSFSTFWASSVFSPSAACARCVAAAASWRACCRP